MVASPLTDLPCTSSRLLIGYVRSCTMYTYTFDSIHWKSSSDIFLPCLTFQSISISMFLAHCSNPTRQTPTMRNFTQYSHLRQSSDLTVDLDDRSLKERDIFLPGSRGSEETRESHCEEEEDSPFQHRSSAALVAHAVLLVCNTVILGLSVLLWLRGGSNCPYGVNGPGLIRSMSSSTPFLPHSSPNMIIHSSHGRSHGLHSPRSHCRH